jgi:hypothetical protein
MNMMPHPTTNHAEPLECRVEEPPFLIPATPFFLFLFSLPGFHSACGLSLCGQSLILARFVPTSDRQLVDCKRRMAASQHARVSDSDTPIIVRLDLARALADHVTGAMRTYILSSS